MPELWEDKYLPLCVFSLLTLCVPAAGAAGGKWIVRVRLRACGGLSPRPRRDRSTARYFGVCAHATELHSLQCHPPPNDPKQEENHCRRHRYAEHRKCDE
eukprot:6870468-Prymnesium_polylepis.1